MAGHAASSAVGRSGDGGGVSDALPISAMPPVLEIMEPLTFKGREGSGLPGGRCAYLDDDLQRGPQDWKKFAYTYRVWGRLLYNPNATPDVWQRSLKRQFGAAAVDAADTSIANASRVLPLITTAHLPSASNHSFWPEIYANMPIVAGSEPSPYNDTPKPNIFSTVSPLDPQLFSSITEFVGGLLDGSKSAKYSPLDVAVWLETFTGASDGALTLMRKQASAPSKPEFRQWEEDVLIQNGIGKFFAAKLRSGMLYEVYTKTGNQQAGKLAVTKYAEARDIWAAMAKRAAKVYKNNVTYGRTPGRRGHWADRQPGIDTDLTAMREAVDGSQTAPDASKQANADLAVKLITGSAVRAKLECTHTPAEKFTPGQPFNLELGLARPEGSVELFYRHVNQGERWRSMPMQAVGGKFTVAIPGEYTDSVYPLQYYFVITTEKSASPYPGFNETLSNQPYYAIWKRNA